MSAPDNIRTTSSRSAEWAMARQLIPTLFRTHPVRKLAHNRLHTRAAAIGSTKTRHVDASEVAKSRARPLDANMSIGHAVSAIGHASTCRRDDTLARPASAGRGGHVTGEARWWLRCTGDERSIAFGHSAISNGRIAQFAIGSASVRRLRVGQFATAGNARGDHFDCNGARNTRDHSRHSPRSGPLLLLDEKR